MKSLVYIATRKWIFSVQQALDVYTTSNIRIIEDYDDEYDKKRRQGIHVEKTHTYNLSIGKLSYIAGSRFTERSCR